MMYICLNDAQAFTSSLPSFHQVTHLTTKHSDILCLFSVIIPPKYRFDSWRCADLISFKWDKSQFDF